MAKAGCPVSKLLNTKITLDATLQLSGFGQCLGDAPRRSLRVVHAMRAPE